MEVLITFIIVTWNNQNEIEKCLESIRKFTNIGYDVVVVDNNSCDNTCRIVKENFPHARLVKSKKNLGFAAGNNLALKTIQTPYICYLNPDTILIEDIITPSISCLENNSKIGLVSCRLLNSNRTIQPSCFKFASSISLFEEILHLGKLCPKVLKNKIAPMYYAGKRDIYTDWTIGAEMVLRTNDAKKIEGFSTDYYMYTEDMDLCMKVHKILSKKVFYFASYRLVHLGGASENQNCNYNKQLKLFENDLTFVKKFNGETKRKKTLHTMIVAYRIRMFLLKILYHYSDRGAQIEKTKQAIHMLRSIG